MYSKTKKGEQLTVWLARFLTRHAKWELRPLTPVTFPEPERSNQGPDSDPVGLGVALSNILLRSFLSDRHSCDAGWAENKKKNYFDKNNILKSELLS